MNDAFEQLASLVHQQHRLASGVESWRVCRLLLCYRAGRLLVASTADAHRDGQEVQSEQDEASEDDGRS
jgi:hypothetical protein